MSGQLVFALDNVFTKNQDSISVISKELLHDYFQKDIAGVGRWELGVAVALLRSLILVGTLIVE